MGKYDYRKKQKSAKTRLDELIKKLEAADYHYTRQLLNEMEAMRERLWMDRHPRAKMEAYEWAIARAEELLEQALAVKNRREANKRLGVMNAEYDEAMVVMETFDAIENR
jgi:gentisate 1,2-dioxygenase